jgi:hypothetical protein
MKVSIEVDLTPSEARELLGMPNLTSIQETFVGIAKDKLERTGNMVDVEPMLRTWTVLVVRRPRRLVPLLVQP